MLFRRKTASPKSGATSPVVVRKGGLGRLNNSWVFFGLSLLSLYALWNPWGVSVWAGWEKLDVLSYDFSSPDPRIPALLLGTFLLLLVLGMMAVGAWRELKPLGFALLCALVGLVLWCLLWLGWMSYDTLLAGWFWQPIAALMLTVGFRWSLFWRAITGRTAVYEDEL